MPRKFDESFRTRHHPINGQKFCKMCERLLPVERFKKKGSRGIVTYCDICYPLFFKYQNVKRKFGLSPEQYDTLVSAGCAICGSKHRLAIDHDHTCCEGKTSCGGCIRGVLCMRHNVTLGQVSDSIEELQLLIKYLEEN